MGERDAFGRETGDDEPHDAPRGGGGPPRWVLYMVAVDAVIMIVVLAVFLA